MHRPIRLKALKEFEAYGAMMRPGTYDGWVTERRHDDAPKGDGSARYRIMLPNGLPADVTNLVEAGAIVHGQPFGAGS